MISSVDQYETLSMKDTEVLASGCRLFVHSSQRDTGSRGRFEKILPMSLKGVVGMCVEWARLDRGPANVRLGINDTIDVTETLGGVPRNISVTIPPGCYDHRSLNVYAARLLREMSHTAAGHNIQYNIQNTTAFNINWITNNSPAVGTAVEFKFLTGPNSARSICETLGFPKADIPWTVVGLQGGGAFLGVSSTPFLSPLTNPGMGYNGNIFVNMNWPGVIMPCNNHYPIHSATLVPVMNYFSIESTLTYWETTPSIPPMISWLNFINGTKRETASCSKVTLSLVDLNNNVVEPEGDWSIMIRFMGKENMWKP
jgi:hypothetical protein